MLLEGPHLGPVVNQGCRPTQLHVCLDSHKESKAMAPHSGGCTLAGPTRHPGRPWTRGEGNGGQIPVSVTLSASPLPFCCIC